VVNHVNKKLMNFWRVLGSEALFSKFHRKCLTTPFSESLWRAVHYDDGANGPDAAAADPVRSAWSFFIDCRQSMAGRMKNFAPLSKRRTRRGMNEQASADGDEACTAASA
jgi:hypothetical protein